MELVNTQELLINIFSGILGAIATVFIAPFWKDYYNKRKEIAYVKQSLRRYVSYMDFSFDVPFMYGCSTATNGEKQYHLSIMFSDFEQTILSRRFDKSIMLSEKDYRNILKYCYTQGISHFDLDSQEKNYTELFLKKKYDFI